MGNFYEISYRTWINLDRVARIEMSRDEKEIVLVSDEGRSLARVEPHNFDPDTLRAVIPAAPDQIVTLIDCTVKDTRPTQDDICVDEYPILAWRITPEGAIPVSYVDTLHNCSQVLLKLQGGKFYQPFGAIFNDIAEAKASCLAEYQMAWDRESGGQSARLSPKQRHCLDKISRRVFGNDE